MCYHIANLLAIMLNIITMKNNTNKLDDLFNENIQYKIQFVRTDGNLKIVRRKIKDQFIKQPKKQLFPISKERS